MPWLAIALVAAAVAGALAPTSPVAVERWYSTGIYPVIERSLTPLSNLLPLAIFDCLVVLLSVLVLVVLVRGIRRSWRSRGPGPVLNALGRLATGGAVIYLIFLGVWGLNYRRLGMSERLVHEPGVPSSEAVAQLGLQAVEQLNALYADAHQRGWAEAEWKDAELRSAFDRVQRFLTDATPVVPGRLKHTVLGPYFRWTSVDGMINPFGLEVLANPDLLPFERPFVAAHEWSHLAGYADESEANFVGWLTCVRADVSARYSGWLYLYWQVSGELASEDRRRLAAALAPGPRRDLEAIVTRLQRGQLPLLRDASWRIYDKYLKANRVPEGIRSYGLVVTLIVQSRFNDGWVPVRKEAE